MRIAPMATDGLPTGLTESLLVADVAIAAAVAYVLHLGAKRAYGPRHAPVSIAIAGALAAWRR